MIKMHVTSLLTADTKHPINSHDVGIDSNNHLRAHHLARRDHDQLLRLARKGAEVDRQYEMYSCRGDELTQEGQQLLNFQGWRGQPTPEIKKEVINALLLSNRYCSR
jgi:hypothetical protein